MTRTELSTQPKSSGKSTATGKPFVAGDPRRMQARGPAKGAQNAGRPPGTFRQFLRTLRADDAMRAAIETAARDPESRAFGHVLKLVAAYDEDGPNPRVAVSEVQHYLRAQFRVVRDLLPATQADQLCAALADVWQFPEA